MFHVCAYPRNYCTRGKLVSDIVATREEKGEEGIKHKEKFIFILTFLLLFSIPGLPVSGGSGASSRRGYDNSQPVTWAGYHISTSMD